MQSNLIFRFFGCWPFRCIADGARPKSARSGESGRSPFHPPAYCGPGTVTLAHRSAAFARAPAKGGSVIDHAIRKLRVRDDLSDAEEALLRAAVTDVFDVGKNQTFVKADTYLSTSNILLEGLVCRYRDMANGERQVTQIHVAGDFVDLHSFPLQRLDHSIMALAPSKVAIVPHDRLRAITENQPHLTRLLWFATTLDAAIHREWMVSIGRRTAISRVAHVLCELYVRMDLVGLTTEQTYPLPLTQVDLAECLGLTPVHVNRTLRALRQQKLVTFRSKTVTVHYFAGLEAVAQFNPNYLFVEKRPR